jgi:hypothetical protein
MPPLDRRRGLVARYARLAGVDPQDVVVGGEFSEADWESARLTLPYETRVLLARAAATAATTQGECRVNGLNDIADVFPVLDADGLHWECNHSDPHQSENVADLKP